MSEIDLTLETLTLRFGDDLFLGELPGLGLLWCAESPRRVEEGLRTLALEPLESARPEAVARLLPAVSESQISTVVVTLDPPPRQLQWVTPVELCLHLVTGRIGDLLVARVPVLGIEIFAADGAELKERLETNIRAALQRRGAGKSLATLLETLEPRSLEAGALTVRADLRDPSSREEKKPDKTSVLDAVSTDLTLFPPRAWHVQAQVAQLAAFLGGHPPQHVLLVGAAGVGKTALVQEFARRRAEFGFPATCFRATNGSRLVAGMSGFGEWQERVGEMAREAARRRAVLHLGHLHELLQSGRHSHNQQGIASFLRPYLARGEFLAIAECTPEQIPVLEREDPHLLEVFVQFRLDEPEPVRGRRILAAVAPSLSDAALAQLDALHRRYATTSAYPGRPLRFLKNLLRDHAHKEPPTPAEVIAAFAHETGLPRVILDEALPLDLAETAQWFRRRVIGQPEAVEQVVALLAVVKQRLARPRKPLASLLFAGPTGVGKTELARSLAAFLFGEADRVTRFDMSEFATPAAVYRLLGGRDSEGQLTAKVREQPFSVLLFDEFEKAHPLFFDLLLPVLGEGRLTDAAGRLADFTNAVVILTSNLGAVTYQSGRLGFATGAIQQRDAREHFSAAVRQAMRPELFNRFDRIVPFSPLDEATVLAIADRELALIRTRDGLRLRSFELGEGVAAHFARVGFDARYGARPLKRAVERGLLVPLADAINRYSSNLELAGSARLEHGAVQVAMSAGGAVGQSPHEARLGLWARDVAKVRRDVQLLAGCGSVQSMANLAARIESEYKRLVRRAPSTPAPGQLRRLRDRLQRVQTVLTELEDAETDLLTALYERSADTPASWSEGQAQLLGRAQALIREVFDARFDQPDFARLAIFSDEKDWLRKLTSALCNAAEWHGATVTVALWESGAPTANERKPVVEVVARASGIPVKLRHLNHVPTNFAAFSDTTLGFQLTIQGPSACALWLEEAGWHAEHTPSKKRRHALVEFSRAHEEYQPPAGMERRGGLTAGEVTRHYHEGAHHVVDRLVGTVPWRDELGSAVRECLTLRLQRNLRMMLEDKA